MCIATSTLVAEPIQFTGLVKLLGKKRPRKQVRFSEQEEVVPMSSAADGESSSNCAWYQRTELALFKLEARDYILGATRGMQVETRGFERYNVERAQNKQIAKACTLLAYRRGMNEAEIASVSQTCTSWARNEAFKLACKDFCEVYHPELVGLVSNMPASSLVEEPKKRVFEASASEGRRVRVRTC